MLDSVLVFKYAEEFACSGSEREEVLLKYLTVDGRHSVGIITQIGHHVTALLEAGGATERPESGLETAHDVAAVVNHRCHDGTALISGHIPVQPLLRILFGIGSRGKDTPHRG